MCAIQHCPVCKEENCVIPTTTKGVFECQNCGEDYASMDAVIGQETVEKLTEFILNSTKTENPQYTILNIPELTLPQTLEGTNSVLIYGDLEWNSYAPYPLGEDLKWHNYDKELFYVSDISECNVLGIRSRVGNLFVTHFVPN